MALIAIIVLVILVAVLTRRHYQTFFMENIFAKNNNEKYQHFKKKLRELDKSRLTNLENFNFLKHTSEQIVNALHAFIMDSTDTACKEKHRFGGGYL